MGIAGIGPALTQLVAAADGRKDHGAMREYISWTVFICLGFTILLMVLALVAGPSAARAVRLDGETAIRVGRLAPVIAALSGYVLTVEVFGAALAGLGRYDRVNLASLIGQVVTLVTAAALLASGMKSEALVAGYALSRTGLHVFYVRSIHTRLPAFLQWRALTRRRLGELTALGGSVLGGTLLNVFLSPFNKWIIARYAGVAAVPVYEIAFGASMQVRNLLEVALRSMIAEVSRIRAEGAAGTVERIRSLNVRALRITAAAGSLIYVAAGLAAPLVFLLWLRRDLDPEQVAVFRTLLAGSFFNLLGTPSYYALIGLGEAKAVFLGYVIQVSANVGIMLVAVWNSWGSALSLAGYAASCGMACSAGFLIWSAMVSTRAKDVVEAYS